MTIKIKRLDHHGIVAGVIDDLNIVPLLDKHLPQDDKQEITPGEAIKGMIMNGLGFSNRPLSLSPQFFTNLPIEHLFREGVDASHFNRHKLGRTLDQCYDFGCESLFSLVSHQACEIEAVDCQFKSLDTTSHSLTGEYADDEDESCDEHVIRITHGHSKAHRPDLKQVVQEMIVSQDGGIPLACKNWDGNSADTKVFKERAKALVKMVKTAPKPNYLVADCKLYHKDNAEFLSQLTFITLIPSTIKLEKTLISEALAVQQWTTIDDNYQYTVNEVEHMDIKQRWIVVNSKAAGERATKTIHRQTDRAKEKLDKDLFHLQAQRFMCKDDALKALAALNKRQKYHQLTTLDCIEQKDEAIQHAIEQKSCFILATNADNKTLTPEAVLHHYKAQSAVEREFRFLKDPLFFVSSLFIKKPSRIDALLMIMTLSLLVYSIAQRRMRASMEKANKTIPNQINIPTATPTLRWVFQCFEGINFVQTEETYDKTDIYLDGLDELRIKIINLIGGNSLHLYNIQKSGVGI
jgi:transposase